MKESSLRGPLGESLKHTKDFWTLALRLRSEHTLATRMDKG